MDAPPAPSSRPVPSPPGRGRVRVLLVRHGQSEWNAVGRWQGRADPPLTDAGRRQAMTASAALGSVDAIVSSPLRRAHHTATILAQAIGVGPVEIDHDLAERDAGEWTGLTLAEIEQRWPGARAAWRTPPGFESDEALLRRVTAALARAAGRFAGTSVLAVTHGGVMYALERHLDVGGPRIPNLGARWVDVDAEGRMWLGERVPLLPEHELRCGPSGGPGAEEQR